MTGEQPWRAARDNAEWCDAVCRSHGITGEFGERVWASARRTPPYYPDAITLTSTASAAEVLALIDTGTPGSTVKDSFARLDLTSAGFSILLEARWIQHPAHWPRRGTRWTPVRDPDALRDWEAAWCGGVPTGVFRPGLLTDGKIAVLAGYTGARITSGAVAHRGPSVAGISNLFTADGDLDRAWAGALSAVAQYFPGLPVVGYEHGDSLDAAIRNGCAVTGPLRVWRALEREGEPG